MFKLYTFSKGNVTKLIFLNSSLITGNNGPISATVIYKLYPTSA